VKARVGLNVLHLVPGETGGSELYARRLVGALALLPDGPPLTLFAAHEAMDSLAAEEWAGSVELVGLPVRARSRVRRVLAEQALLPRAVRRSGAALLHNLFTTAPALPSVPQVTTVLDVIYRRFPETHGRLYAAGMRLLVPLATRRSRRVLTLSESSKADIVRLLHVPAAQVDVTPLGPGLEPRDDFVDEAELRRRLELGARPLLLTVSAKRPHKNLRRLIDAVARLDDPPMLVLPGYETGFEPGQREHAQRALGEEGARFLGWVDDATLEGLYRAATALVLPSLAEGFGLSVLDALLRGVPVACSDTSSLPEVAGDAAVYFDPEDVEAIADALRRVLGDEKLRRLLRIAGPEQARQFTWERTARATVESYERALSNRS
jgi:glycosyltransferase involved in cell wall biosynthesis